MKVIQQANCGEALFKPVGLSVVAPQQGRLMTSEPTQGVKKAASMEWRSGVAELAASPMSRASASFCCEKAYITAWIRNAIPRPAGESKLSDCTQ